MKKLSVYLNLSEEKQIIGELFESASEGIVFEYNGDFLKKEINLSPFKLDFRTGLQFAEYEPFNGLFGLFADSLPDGWGMLLMDRYLQKSGTSLSKVSPLDRLAFVADSGMGALSYYPPSKRALNDFEIDLEKLAFESQEILSGKDSVVLDRLLNLGASPGGARPKVLVAVSGDQIISGVEKVPEGFTHWIIKFYNSKMESKESGVIEYIYSQLAKKVGIDIPETRLFSAKEKKFFGIKRFDRDSSKRFHIHTLAGLLQSNFRLPALDYRDLFQVTQILCKDVRQVQEAFRRMAFNVIFCNQDDHAKNFSFIYNQGKWKLSPAYDLTYCPNAYNEQYMSIAGKGKDICSNDMISLGKEFNLKKSFCFDCIQLMEEEKKQLPVLCREYGLKNKIYLP